MLALSVLLLAGGAFAQEEAEIDPSIAEAVKSAAAQARPASHPLTNMPPPVPTVETAFVFPKYAAPKPQFPAGASVDVLVGFRNGANEPYNVTAIMGSLNSPLDFSIYVQNFTHQAYGLRVEPADEGSFLYTFRPDPALHPREFTVALTVFYTNAAGQMSSTTFFNSTIEIVEAPRTIDSEILMLWAMLLGGVGFAVFKAYTFAMKLLGKKGGKGKRRSVPVDTSSDDWLTGTALGAERKKAEKAAASKAAAAKIE